MLRVETAQGHLTIPVTDDVREKLSLRLGDELIAQVIEGSIVYTPAKYMAADGTWNRLIAVTARVTPTPDQAQKPSDLEEQEILAEIHTVRRAMRGTTGHN